MFGYGFGDMDALNRLNFSWLTVPVMGTVGARSVCYPLSITYHEFSFLCRAGLLCVPHLRIIIITDHPDIRHLCPFPCSFSLAVLLIFLQVSLTGFVAGMITGVYFFQASDAIKLNNWKTYIAVGVCN